MNQASEELKEQPKKKLSALEKMDEILLRCDEIEQEVGRCGLEFTLHEDLDESNEQGRRQIYNVFNAFPQNSSVVDSREGAHLLLQMELMNIINLVKDNFKNNIVFRIINPETLIERQYLKFKLSFEGYKRIDELRKSIDSTQAFVAMWFDKSMNEAFNAMKEAVEECGYRAYRVDEDEHNQNITFKIIGEIRRSKFLIADFTGLRGGVYWEAGFAYGLGREVIYCMHEQDFKTAPPHFDIQQINFILWRNPEDLRTKLIDRIRATVV